MNPFTQTLAQYTMSNWMQFMGEFRALVLHLDKIAAELDINAITADFSAAEALVDVEGGEVAVWGGYDTNDVRRMDALATAFDMWLAGNTIVTLANGDTETKTNRQLVGRFYGPFQG
jgi:hypothetical protein